MGVERKLKGNREELIRSEGAREKEKVNSAQPTGESYMNSKP